ISACAEPVAHIKAAARMAGRIRCGVMEPSLGCWCRQALRSPDVKSRRLRMNAKLRRTKSRARERTSGRRQPGASQLAVRKDDGAADETEKHPDREVDLLLEFLQPRAEAGRPPQQERPQEQNDRRRRRDESDDLEQHAGSLARA